MSESAEPFNHLRKSQGSITYNAILACQASHKFLPFCDDLCLNLQNLLIIREEARAASCTTQCCHHFNLASNIVKMRSSGKWNNGFSLFIMECLRVVGNPGLGIIPLGLGVFMVSPVSWYCSKQYSTAADLFCFVLSNAVWYKL